MALISDQEGSASKNFILSASVWIVIGMLAGFVGSFQLIPGFSDLTKGVSFFNFGRLRPLHVNLVAFGWLSMMQIGAMFYMIPKLCRTKLYSEKLGNLVCLGWNLVVITAVIVLPLGYTEGREWAELPWFLDILVLVALALVAYNNLRTIANRREKQLYVSIWYFTGATVWMPMVYFVGNRTFNPIIKLFIPSFDKGLNDGIVNWFYAHNVLGLWFTTSGVAITYYLIPYITKKPLYSHFLSILGFTTIAMFYTPTGTHHILQSPVPEWAKSVAVISSVMLLVPVSTVLINFFKTMEGKWGMMADNLPLRFAITGAVGYLLTCFTGPFQATRWINWYLHFTHWVVWHAHLALLGTFSFWGWAASYYIIPRVVKRPMYSRTLVNAHYWFATIGFIIMSVALFGGGMIQSAGWNVGMTVFHTSQMQAPFMALRTISGIMLLISVMIFAYNIFRTVFASQEQEQEQPIGENLPAVSD